MKMMFIIGVLGLTWGFSCGLQPAPRPELSLYTIYEAKELNFYADVNSRKAAIDNGQFKPENCILGNIAVNDNDKTGVFVTIPRIKSSQGCPYNLAKLYISSKITFLQPFPDANVDLVGNCNHIQNPLGIEIDQSMNRIYIADSGRVGYRSGVTQVAICPPKLWILDIAGTVVKTHTIPETTAPRYTTELSSNIVLDYVSPRFSKHLSEHPKYAYITDSGNSRLIVQDLLSNASWSFVIDSTVTRDPEYLNTTINGEFTVIDRELSGLAMSPDFDYVYLSTTTSQNIYQIATWELRRQNSNYVNLRIVGSKSSYSDGIVRGTDNLFYGSLLKDAVYKWETRKDMLDQNKPEGEVTANTLSQVTQNWQMEQWVNSLNLDDAGFLWFTSNRKHQFYSNTMDFSGKTGNNFGIYKIDVKDYSYLSIQNSRLPVIG